MAFSPLADMSRRIPDQGRSNPRNYAVSGFGIHHNAGVNSWAEASNPNRQVSANYWIANNGAIIPNIDEERRAWTSGASGYPAGAQADHRNITVEVSNSPEGVRNGTWAISDAAFNSLVALIAEVYRRRGLGPVLRGASRGIGVHQDWVPTACPGPYIMQHLGTIIARAEALRTGQGPEPEPEPTKRRRSEMLGLMANDGLGRYGKVGECYYATYDGRAFVYVSRKDGDPVSVNMGEAFANVTYHAFEGYAAAAEVIVDSTVSPPQRLSGPKGLPGTKVLG